MTTDRVLYANPVMLATDASNLILSTKKTETHTIPFIPADTVKPMQVALILATNTLVMALNLWTKYESGDTKEVGAFDNLTKFFSEIRTRYWEAQAKARELSEQKVSSND
jgi:hypothetical protein